MSEGGSGCLFSLGARSAAGCGGKASCEDASCGDRGVVVGEGEKSGCDGCGGVLAGEVGVGEMWSGVEGRGCGGGVMPVDAWVEGKEKVCPRSCWKAVVVGGLVVWVVRRAN